MKTPDQPATDGWEEWQVAYRFGLLVIFPPDPLRSMANALRSRYDPDSQGFGDVHIALTVPAPRRVEATEWAELERVASLVQPFSVRYGPLKTPPATPGITLAIEPQDRLDSLRAALEGVAPFNEAPPRAEPFSAWLTIAKLVDAEQSPEVLEELAETRLSGRFTCSRVTWAMPDERFHFSAHGQLRLGH